MPDDLEALRIQVALNQARYNDSLIKEVRAKELSEGVAIYRGIEPKTGRALIQSLGSNSAIPVGRLITNGAIKLGQRVQLTRHDSDTYFADALPHSGGGGSTATEDALDKLLPSRGGGGGGFSGRSPIGYNSVNGTCTPVFSGTAQYGSLEECTAGETGATCSQVSTAVGGSLSYSAPEGKKVQSVRQLEGNDASCAPAVVSADRKSVSGGGSVSAACGYDICTVDAEKKWICQNGQCLEVSDSGTYASKTECEAALVPEPYTGGQCPGVEYYAEITATNYGNKSQISENCPDLNPGSFTTHMAGIPAIIGPVSDVETIFTAFPCANDPNVNKVGVKVTHANGVSELRPQGKLFESYSIKFYLADPADDCGETNDPIYRCP